MWILVVIAVSQGQPPTEYRYAMQDRDACITAKAATEWTRNGSGIGFAALCVPKNVESK